MALSRSASSLGARRHTASSPASSHPPQISPRSVIFYILVAFACAFYWTSELRTIESEVRPARLVASEEDIAEVVKAVTGTHHDIAVDTALILSSSWIPTHPSTALVDAVIASVDKLIGMHPMAPIFVVVDHMKLPGTPGATRYHKEDYEPPHLPTQEEMDKLVMKHASLDEYVQNLYLKYLNNPRVHIVPSVDHWHIGGTVLKAMNLIERHYPKVEYLYYLQHDFAFVRNVNHLAMVDLMKEHSNVNYIRFRYKAKENFKEHTCPIGASSMDKVTTYEKDDVFIFQTAHYTDQNHFVRFRWYRDEVIGAINGGHTTPSKPVKRAPEGPLMHRAKKNCVNLGMFTYGQEHGEQPILVNLDGRLTTDLADKPVPK
jgi:hypothetical protein